MYEAEIKRVIRFGTPGEDGLPKHLSITFYNPDVNKLRWDAQEQAAVVDFTEVRVMTFENYKSARMAVMELSGRYFYPLNNDHKTERHWIQGQVEDTTRCMAIIAKQYINAIIEGYFLILIIAKIS